MKKFLISMMMLLFFTLTNAGELPKFIVSGGYGYLSINDGENYSKIFGKTDAILLNFNTSILLNSLEDGTSGLYFTANWSKYGADGASWPYKETDIRVDVALGGYGLQYAIMNNNTMLWFGGGYATINVIEKFGSSSDESYTGSGWFAETGNTVFLNQKLLISIIARYNTVEMLSDNTSVSEGNFDGGGFSVLFNAGFYF